ncbi:MAG: transporter [Cyanobacteria bacterium SW_9_44_58]|nr:MAG: transporter [Cyanobacteria bacterium SW_9_44_58]
MLKILKSRFRWDRNEFSGAFGDIGADLPLLISVANVANLNGTNLLVMFGGMQILSGLLYPFPMPVQPLKAMATIVISQKLTAATLHGAGLAIGIIMLLLTFTGSLEWLAKKIPKSVVRGIQFGLGLKLASVALGDFVQTDGITGYGLAAIAFIIAVILIGNRRLPAALPIIAMGVGYAVFFQVDTTELVNQFGVQLPSWHVPTLTDIQTGFIVLTLPQIPLSLGNSVLATRQLVQDYFPHQSVTIRKIGFTYAVMNLINPWFGGMPTCHGSGGIAGHFVFGARTGGSVIIYGILLLGMGLFFGSGFDLLAKVFPLPILGVLLLFKAVALVALIRDTAHLQKDFSIIIIVGLLGASLPYGFALGLLVGVILHYFDYKIPLGVLSNLLPTRN